VLGEHRVEGLELVRPPRLSFVQLESVVLHVRKDRRMPYGNSSSVLAQHVPRGPAQSTAAHVQTAASRGDVSRSISHTDRAAKTTPARLPLPTTPVKPMMTSAP